MESKSEMFISKFKDSLYGYVAMESRDWVDYENKLYYIYNKLKKYKNKKKSYVYPLSQEYINDYIRLEYKKGRNWRNIKSRHKGDDKWKVYKNYIDNIFTLLKRV